MIQKERIDDCSAGPFGECPESCTNVHLVSQRQVDEQLEQIKRRIGQIGRLQDIRSVSKKVIRTLERINVLRQLDLIAETEANQLAYRVKQAGKEGNGKAAAG